MHHIIFPIQDTFITNRTNLLDKNFGLDEILCIGSSTYDTKVTLDTKEFFYVNEPINSLLFLGSFTGNVISASFSGSASFITGSTLNGTGSISGIAFSGSRILSGSNLSGSATIFNGSINSFNGFFYTGSLTGTSSYSSSHQVVSSSKYINRTLIKFDITEISKSISSGDIESPSFALKMNLSRAENIPIDYNIYAYPISQSWNYGTGYFSDGGSDDGVSWIYRDELNGMEWSSSGANWYVSTVSSQSFFNISSDINMNITNIVYSWLSGSIPNNGILIKTNELSNINLKYFSKDTNTIYTPRLDVGWDDSSWITGSVENSSSLEPIQFNRPFITVLQNLPKTVKSGNIIRINVFAREEFPLKNFNRQTQLTQFLTSQYLPSSSFYAIKDNQTEELMVDFDSYTKLSCDINGNYFNLDVSGLPQERYFKILIKTESSGSIYEFDRDDIFKVVR